MKPVREKKEHKNIKERLIEKLSAQKNVEVRFNNEY
jgi:hypothetical protein